MSNNSVASKTNAMIQTAIARFHLKTTKQNSSYLLKRDRYKSTDHKHKRKKKKQKKRTIGRDPNDLIHSSIESGEIEHNLRSPVRNSLFA